MDRRRLQQILIIGITCLLLTAADDVDDFDEATVEVVEEPSVDIPYTSPTPIDSAKVYIAEHFDDLKKFEKNWIKSAAKKEGIAEDIAKYDGEWHIEAPQKDGLIGDLGLVLKSKAKHSAISSRLSRPFSFNTKPLIVQYEVLLQDGQECGGAYLKLLTDGPDTKNLGLFHDKTPYTIMFGPDKCGHDHKLHFIFRHVNPKNGSVEEKHCKKPKDRLDDYFTDKLPHLYTLRLKPDNTFEILIDKKLINSGSLLDDFTPPVNPPSEIDDPNDKKPTDWDEREKIPDPEAVKPDDWDEDAPAQIIDENAVVPDGWLEDEPRHIPDPDAVKPEDWDSEMDGEWEPPLIDNPACSSAVGCGKWEPPLINNPKYKGKWVAPFIDNPNYKGKWRPRRIPNPDFFEDTNPFRMQTISAVGFELWTMSSDIYFDNLIISDDMVIAEHWAAETFDKKRQKIAKDSATLWGRMLRSMNYRPKSWALFCLYCSIPICFYIRYIWFCVKEASVVEKLAKLTNDYPALWLLYIVILGIPVTFILYLCCKPSSSASQQEREEQRQAADKKKTDEVTEDDPEVKHEDIIEELKEQAAEEDEDKEKYSDQDDNEEDVDAKKDEKENEKKKESDNEKKKENDNEKKKENDDEKKKESDNEKKKESDNEKEESIEELSNIGEGDVPRKRKPRKE